MSEQTQEQPKGMSEEQAAAAENFIRGIQSAFMSQMATQLTYGLHQIRLAQHLFVKIDYCIKDLELKRSKNQHKKNEPPITWENINMPKLWIDAGDRIEIGLDANIPNHIHVLPYLNSRTNKYDVDLMLGYVGEALVKRKFSIDPIVSVWDQLVHEGDEVSVGENPHGGRKAVYKAANAFKPGAVIGGFTEIKYEDPRKDHVYFCEYREFEKAEEASKSVKFWGGLQDVWDEETRRWKKGEYEEKFRKEMQFKTVVRRGAAKLKIDPERVSQRIIDALADPRLDAIEADFEDLVGTEANKQPLSLEGNADSTILGDDIVGEMRQAQQQRVEEEAQVRVKDEGPGY